MTNNSHPNQEPEELNISAQEEDLESESNEQRGLFRGIRRSVANNAGRIGKLAANAGGNVAKQTGRASQAVGNTAISTGKAIAQGSMIAGQQIVKTPKRLGNVIQFIENNPQLKKLANNVKGLDFLLPLLDKVNVIDAQENVASLKRRFPQEKPNEIANRIISEKALIAAGSGFASSSVPGAATLLFASDLAANTALQAEMLYQIAACYELDLEAPERKGEILTIFGLAFGGNYAVKTGLRAISRNIPIAGSIVGASSNAVLIFSLGKIACQFYESQLNNPEENLEEVLEECQENNETFLEDMANQETIMDEIFAHMWIAGAAERNLSDLLILLSSLNMSPSSLEKLQTAQNLTPLDQLISKLSPEYYSTVLTKCHLIAKADTIITPQEQEILTQLEAQLQQK